MASPARVRSIGSCRQAGRLGVCMEIMKPCLSLLKCFGRRVKNSLETGLVLFVGRMTRSIEAKSSGKCNTPLSAFAINRTEQIAGCNVQCHGT